MSNEQPCSLLIAHCSLFLAANFGHTAIKRDNILIKFMSPQFPPNRFGDGSCEFSISRARTHGSEQIDLFFAQQTQS